MTFPEIFNNTEISPEKQLFQLIALVTNIRVKYGNTEVEIPTEDLVTIHGCTPMAMLSTKSRVAAAEQEIDHIVAEAYEDTQATVGINFDRRLEELVAISPTLNSLNDSLNSDYL